MKAFSAPRRHKRRSRIIRSQRRGTVERLESRDLFAAAIDVPLPVAGDEGDGLVFDTLADGQYAQSAMVAGTIWDDLDGDGRRDEGEPGLPLVTVYLDENENGLLDADERSTTTSSEGRYVIGDLLPGSYTVAQSLPTGWGATSPDLLHRFRNPTPAAGDWFGGAAAVVGNSVLIGAPGDDEAGLDTGAVYLFDGTTGRLLQEFQGHAVGEAFGAALATDGNHMVVGALDAPGDVGAAYLYTLDGPEWSSWEIPNPTPNANDLFGHAVAVKGKYVLVSAVRDDPGGMPDCGAVYLYDASTRSLVQTFQPDSLRASQDFGFSVAFFGDDKILIGAQREGSGVVYLFDLATGALLHKYTSPQPDGYFGRSVAARGNEVLIAGWNHTSLFSGVAPYNVLRPAFGPGQQVSAVGQDVAIIPCGGATSWLYDGQTGTLLKSYSISNPDFLNLAVAFGNDILIGAPGEDADGTNAGAAYLFRGPGVSTRSGIHRLSLVSGQVVNNLDFGNQQLAEIRGTKWNDFDGDGVRDSGEPGLADWTLFLDLDYDGQLDSGEPSTVTGADGSYRFTNLIPGEYTVAEVLSPGWRQSAAVASDFSDDFEDNAVDAGQWRVGGRCVAWTPTEQGSWTWSNEETFTEPGDSDGYFRSRLLGPYTGNSYGAVAWIRTAQDFNDGQFHVQDFTWKSQAADSHANMYQIQVTDGYVPTFAENHWVTGWIYLPEPPGTTNLLWSGPTEPFGAYPAGTPKLTWSIVIDPAGVARLYDEPGGHGQLLSERALDPSRPWYTRWLIFDGTSAGFGDGDAQLNLYGFASQRFSRPGADGRLATHTVTLTSGQVAAGRDFGNYQDGDGDGIPDVIESASPNRGDGNRDGKPDAQQPTVASFPNAKDGKYVTLVVAETLSLVGVSALSNPSPTGTPPDVGFPDGCFQFTVAGPSQASSATVTVFLEPGATLNTYFKYGPTTDDRTNHWYSFMFDGTTGAKIFGDRIELHFVDGLRGDDDLQENGKIVDAGAPGYRQHAWQNPAEPCDTNNDGLVTPLDVLMLISKINAGGVGLLPPAPQGLDELPPYLDVSGDDVLAPLDVLIVVNYLNSHVQDLAEGEAVPRAASPEAPVAKTAEDDGRANNPREERRMLDDDRGRTAFRWTGMTDRPTAGRIKPARIPPADDSLLAPLEDVVRDLADDIDRAWHTART